MNEKEILDKIPGIFPQGPEVVIGPGDDCAVIDFGMDRYFLMAVDQLVSDIHYDRDSTLPAKIAKKLLNRNLSDIAAMGGTPAQALATMALSKKTASDDYWIQEFLESISKEAEKWGVSVCGGDISSSGSKSDSFSLTITGWVPKESLCLRSSAKPGDVLLATGLFGNSLSSGHHIDFTPRIEQAQFVAGTFTKAMIDVSDGVLLDSARLAEMSGLGLILDTDEIPSRNKASLKKRLTDGEDYELLLAVHPQKAELLLHEWAFDDIPLTEIGLFTSENPGIVMDKNHKVLYDGPESKAGYLHS